MSEDNININNENIKQAIQLLEIQKIIDNAALFSAKPVKPKPVIVTMHEFLSYPLKNRESILSPWLTTQSLNMIYSWRGVGKTHIALAIAYAVASGSEFLGWSANKPREVLYIDGEMPANALQERLAKINISASEESHEGSRNNESHESNECKINTANSNKETIANKDFPKENFRLYTPDLQIGSMPDLASTEGQQIIDELILPTTELIIIDNLSCLARSGGRENDAESWQSIGQWALAKRAQGKSILFIHHAGKDGNQRGTSKREDILDSVIALKHPSNYKPDEGAHFEIHFEKARHLSGKDVKPFTAQLISKGQKQEWKINVLETSTKRDKIFTLHEQGLSNAKIADKLGINRTTVLRNIKAVQHHLKNAIP